MSNFNDDIELPAFLKNTSLTPGAAVVSDDLDFPSIDDADLEGVDIGLDPEEAVDPVPAPVPEPAKPKRGRKPKAEKAVDPKPVEPKPEPGNMKEVAKEVAKIVEQGEKEVAALHEKQEAENPRAKPGSNSGVAGDQLKAIVERIERLVEEKQATQGDISDVFAEAKGNGFDVSIIRKLLKLRKQSASERAEEKEILDLYMWALGME